jgi:hypothetical protein
MGSRPSQCDIPAWRPLPSDQAYRQLFKGMAAYYASNKYEVPLITEQAPAAVRIEHMPRRLTKGSLVIDNTLG